MFFYFLILVSVKAREPEKLEHALANGSLKFYGGITLQGRCLFFRQDGRLAPTTVYISLTQGWYVFVGQDVWQLYISL